MIVGQNDHSLESVTLWHTTWTARILGLRRALHLCKSSIHGSIERALLQIVSIIALGNRRRTRGIEILIYSPAAITASDLRARA